MLGAAANVRRTGQRARIDAGTAVRVKAGHAAIIFV